MSHLKYTDHEYRRRTTEMIKQEELTSVEVALLHFLNQFDPETVKNAAPTSCIGNVLRVYNRVENLQLGHDVNFRLDRWE